MSNSYENTKHKIRRNFEGAQDNENQVTSQVAINVLKNGQIVRLRSTSSTFRRIQNLTTDWTGMLPVHDSTFDIFNVTAKGLNFVVTATIPEEAIADAKFDVEYRTVNTDPIAGNSVTFQYFVTVDDLVGQPLLKQVTWYVGWVIQQSGVVVQHDLEARLLFSIPNPNLYV